MQQRKARTDYETALAESDACIIEIAETAKAAEEAERLRAEMYKLRRKGDEERADFEIQLAGAHKRQSGPHASRRLRQRHR